MGTTEQSARRERRRFARVERKLPVRVWGTDRAGGHFFADGVTEDLSPDGVRLTLEGAPDPSRPLLLYVHPPEAPGEASPFRMRILLETLRLESVPGQAGRWRVAGRFRPDQCEWLRVENGGAP